MVLDEILKLDISGKNVLIIGCPASGKTWLSNKLDDGEHEVIHTDIFSGEGYELGMYSALTAVSYSDKPTIVEGIHGYRMLRKGAEFGNYYPDIVIEIKIPESKMVEVYKKERNPDKIEYLARFNKTTEKVLSDYKKAIPDRLKPQWVIFENNY